MHTSPRPRPHPIPAPIADPGGTLAAAQRLRNVVRLNALFSMVGATSAMAAPTVVADVLGVDHPGAVRALGVGLALFATGLGVLSTRPVDRLRRWTPALVSSDVGWVVASAATMAAGWYATSGDLVVGTVATAVAAFAGRQWWALRHLRRLDPHNSVADRPPVEVLRVRRTIEAPTADVWAQMVDHELYGRLAPTLSAVRATTPNGAGLERTCANRKGETWHESCTLWDEGHRFDVTVDTSDYPYPLAEMQGSWWVEPASGDDGPQPSSVVGMDFRYRPRPGPAGAALAAAMQLVFPPVLRRILRGWRDEALRPNGDR
ncbi:MAG: SRPBCC family protein [Acidimicrobiia bacterium]|nr:SRPBCC family protein [Acidimicrobiia bacterium]